MTSMKLESTQNVTALRADLRSVVIRRLGDRGLSHPDALAAVLGVAPSTAVALLRRSEWSVEQALWVSERAGLGIEVAVKD
jgi:hypothetical protein